MQLRLRPGAAGTVERTVRCTPITLPCTYGLAPLVLQTSPPDTAYPVRPSAIPAVTAISAPRRWEGVPRDPARRALRDVAHGGPNGPIFSNRPSSVSASLLQTDAITVRLSRRACQNGLRRLAEFEFSCAGLDGLTCGLT